MLIKCRTCQERLPRNQYSKNVFHHTGLQPDCKACMKEKVQRGKTAGKAPTLPLEDPVAVVESRIEAAITDHIKKLQASRKRLKKGKIEIQIVNGKVQVTI